MSHIYYIKFRRKGSRHFYFLTGHGEATNLKVHASRFDDLEVAQRMVDKLAADNTGLDLKVVRSL